MCSALGFRGNEAKISPEIVSSVEITETRFLTNRIHERMYREGPTVAQLSGPQSPITGPAVSASLGDLFEVQSLT
jgi:hypothetical protein